MYLHLKSVHPVTIMALPSQLCISKPSVDFLCARFLPSVCSCKYPAGKTQKIVHLSMLTVQLPDSNSHRAFLTITILAIFTIDYIDYIGNIGLAERYISAGSSVFLPVF